MKAIEAGSNKLAPRNLALLIRMSDPNARRESFSGRPPSMAIVNIERPSAADSIGVECVCGCTKRLVSADGKKAAELGPVGRGMGHREGRDVVCHRDVL